jgi:hypothetical protein
VLHAAHKLGLRKDRNDRPKIIFEFVEDSSRLTACLTFDYATTEWNEVLVNTRLLQSDTIQYRRMTGAMPQNNRAIAGNYIEVMPGWVSFLG